ncbi:LysR substrate-binding domain-containing protein [Pseudoglutamicibacter albus]|uniref:LysR substrate-binding domain-containing protein n=1 Tax=Pseudoglutamicibacter albus TaxID=98671 RepID=UPI001EF56D7D|nr:LysR substrate-binding domain-containing protein [Pseudoglutamicibacter albus]
MEIKALRYFTAVAETLHFGEAAMRLHIAQPVLSQTIARLEKELGTTLLNRTTRKVELTDAGAYLNREARRVLADVDSMFAGVRNIAGGSAGIIRIGFTGTTGFAQLARIKQAVGEALPNITLEVHTDLLTPAQLERIRNGQLDMGILRGHTSDPELETYPLGTEKLVAAMPEGHRLASVEGELALKEFEEEHFIAFGDPRSNVNARAAASCHAAGFTPHIAHTAPGTAGLLALVAAGAGVAFIPESVQALRPQGVVFKSVPETLPTDLALVTRAGTSSPVVKHVIEALVDNDVVSADADNPDRLNNKQIPVTQA